MTAEVGFPLPTFSPDPVDLPLTLLPERLSPADVDRMKAFIGTWKTRKSIVTHKSNITLTFVLGTDSLTGYVRES